MATPYPPPSLLIFDLDGTLVDSFADITGAVNLTLKQMGQEALPSEEIQHFIGKGAKWLLSQTLQRIGLTEETDLAQAREIFYPTYRENLVVHTRAFAGVYETLDELVNRSIPLAVCTNKPFALAHPLLEELDLLHYFQEVLGGDSLPTKKPDPAPLTHLMKHFEAAPDATWMIGDSQYDILAGQAAGTRTCAVTFGHLSREAIDTYTPDAVITHFQQLLALWE